MSLLRENISVAFRSVRAQVLRTVLTISIIAIGITALVGILTSIDAIESKITSDFSRLGANTFSIMSKSSRGRQRGKTQKTYEKIDYYQASAFKNEYHFPAAVAISSQVSFNATVKHEGEKTNPNVAVIGCDESYLKTTGYDLESGRSFSKNELLQGNNVAILGKDIVDKVFSGSEEVIGKSIYIGAAKFTVIGILESKGSSIGFSGDNQVLVPVGYTQRNLETEGTWYNINIMTNDPTEVDKAIAEATGLMRKIRKDPLSKEDSFRISRSESLANELLENLSTVTIAASVIGAITLLGAAIGLMNIMLVSVTERTKEIGLRKSLGASSKTILSQFLIEAIVIGQLGGYLGIILGILIGNITASVVGTSFIIPWDWMIFGVLLCVFIGIVSGIYPARKAASLDPIEALRHE
jgi:putative ABC transport system permease protein